MSYITIDSLINPYRDHVQGKANEPITVAALLDRAYQLHGVKTDCTLGAIYDRLEANAPRIGIIGGSSDHPAHVKDWDTMLRAAVSIWRHGGVPFYFSVPVVCDGTAQGTMGMSYSLQSRNAVTSMVVNQMEGQQYHAAFVIQGCDKTPMALVSALAHLDRVRRMRGEAPVWGTFAPAHVLKGGTIPPDAVEQIGDLARRAAGAGFSDLAEDIEENLLYILQCSSNEVFQGLFERAVQEGIMSAGEQKELEKRLAVSTCDTAGGICAFHGTGNSSRDVVAALGLVHPAVELLTMPPTQAQVDASVGALFRVLNRPDYSVSSMVAGNIGNAIRVHSALGGSSNLMMHIVAAMLYAGHSFSLLDAERIHSATPVPDIFDYSLTQGRDIFALAQQCCAGQIRGMETVFYELGRNGCPMDLDAPTVTGQTWRERMADTSNLSADGVHENPIILSTPRRAFSGVDVLRSNWFESAIVKTSGMPDALIDKVDDKIAFVLYFETEEAANEALVDPDLLQKFRNAAGVSPEALRQMYAYNSRNSGGGSVVDPTSSSVPTPIDNLYDQMISNHTLRIAIVISGQGPEAFGMPEMAVASFRVNYNRVLRQLVTLITDGRYSGTNFGASVGHVTPEAIQGGGIGYLQTGDLLHLQFRAGRINLLDTDAFIKRGAVKLYSGDLAGQRAALHLQRKKQLQKRAMRVAPSNRMLYHTDAAHGVVPLHVAEWANMHTSLTAVRDISANEESYKTVAGV
ncbi:MAG: dihydroxy-acid dehydratase [Chloroflexota bacterium]|nr:dihydroxy-acid dehydratase [Chloroflexota bacterium]